MERDAAPPPGPDAGSQPARPDAFVTIERRLGAPRLFATAYSTVGSSIYFALGVVAAYALGLTPFVFLVAGLLFVLTTLTYFEGMTVHPERGGSAVMARYAFNEFWSFIAGWAILLDYLILIAISDALDRPLPGGVLVAARRATASTSRSRCSSWPESPATTSWAPRRAAAARTALAIVDLALVAA